MHFIDPPRPDLRSDNPDAPNYEVTFWLRQTSPDDPGQSWYESEVWQLGGADVKQVIMWADARVGDHRTHQVKVAVSDTETVSNLVTLFGENPVRGNRLD